MSAPMKPAVRADPLSFILTTAIACLALFDILVCLGVVRINVG